MHGPIPFGIALRTADDTPEYLPLKSVSINATVIDISARVELTQIYANADVLQNAGARYLFPIPDNAAVCAFRMETADGRAVRSVVKEKELAKQEFKGAVKSGKWAGLLEEITGDVFSVSVGAIPHGQDIRVYINYVQELPQDDLVNQVRFTLPTYIAVRYGCAPSAVTEPYASSNCASLHINVDVRMASPIQKIASPSHEIHCTEPAKDYSWANQAPVYKTNVTFAPDKDFASLTKDFILTVQASALHKPRCLASVSPTKNSVAMSLTLVPQFGIPPVPFQEYIFVIDRSGSMGGFIRFAQDALTILLKSLPEKGTCFNVASFGSQYETLWEESRPYGSESLSEAVGYVQSMTANMGGTEIKPVLEYVFQSRAQNIPTSVIVLTDGAVWNTDQVLTITRTAVTAAGAASTDSSVYLRVFTLGIGNGVSTALCEGLARTGNGLCYTVTNSADIPSRCTNLLKAARAPPLGSLWGLSVDWGHKGVGDRAVADDNDEKEKMKIEIVSSEGIPAKIDPKIFSFFDETLGTPEEISIRDTAARLKSSSATDVSHARTCLVKQAPAKVPEIYPFNRFIVSAILLETTQVPDSVTLKGTLPGTGEEVKMTFQVQQVDEDTSLLHTLAARRLIMDLQDGANSSMGLSSDIGGASRVSVVGPNVIEQTRKEIVRLSEEYQLASHYVAFVAVEDTPTEESTEEEGDWVRIDLVQPVKNAATAMSESGTATNDKRSAIGRGKYTTGGGAFRARRILMPDDPSEVETSSDESEDDDQKSSEGAADVVEPSPKKIRIQPSRIAKIPARGSQSTSGVIGSVMRLDPVNVALLQSHTGSVHLTDDLVKLLALGLDAKDKGAELKKQNQKPTLAGLKQRIPGVIRDLALSDAEREDVWATLLAAALMKKYMGDTKETWVGLWEKAKTFVVERVGGKDGLFMALLEEAERCV